MKNKKINKKVILHWVIFIVALFLIIFSLSIFFPGKENLIKDSSEIFGVNQNTNPNGQLSSAQIMQVIKTDKDYANLSGFIKDFDPVVVNYIKLGPTEYTAIKPEWIKQGFADRIKIVDNVNLTNSTYWIEVKNKKDPNKGFQTIIDTNQNKSILLMASLVINASLSM